ncbi:MAG: bifunctional 3,4-dihydroxy-2-butanone-4-phosphate synthase/GTP cyclohydrolase II [Acidobacteria bacterium]|nr:bifunctional 3,4-dihydroxy-2-butanone-4-phosphate synthase/GTP cyclohydrolase II [Acidobacteriota bacterium]
MARENADSEIIQDKDDTFDSIDDAVVSLKNGEMIIIADDEDRENEGDLVIAAEFCDSDAINFMAKYGRGLICLSMTNQRLDELQVPLMVERNTASFGTAFCVSIEAKEGTTTGISAPDRARTVKVAIDPKTKPEDLNRPGHMFPLRAEDGGVLKRTGQTEASVDMAKIAGLYPAAVICEIMKDDGTMARIPDLKEFKKEHGIKLITVAELVRYRMQKESLVEKVASPELPTKYGKFIAHTYTSTLDENTHMALVMGDIKPDDKVLVRVHSECLTGDVFGSQRCDCGEQLDRALKMIGEEGKGILVYLRQEGRGIGLHNKMKAYELQERGADTVEANEKLGFKADQRDFGIGAQILADLGIRDIRILSNNPRKFVALKGYGLNIVERIPLEIDPTDTTKRYLKTKKEKLGHLLTKV